MPEGLLVILSVVLALGVQRMALHKAVVKRLTSVETLGSASVICSDKTGTLTRSEITIQEIVTASGATVVTGIGYAPDGEVAPDANRDGRPDSEPLAGALRDEVTVSDGAQGPYRDHPAVDPRINDRPGMQQAADLGADLPPQKQTTRSEERR